MLQGIVYHDAEGEIISINKSAEVILGRTAEELLGKESASLVPDTIREDGTILPGPGLRHGLTCRWKRHDRGTFRARKRTEEALKESENRYRAVTETALDAIITIDQESTIILTNAAVETIFDYTRFELLGRSLTILMPERLRKRHQYALKMVYRHGQETPLLERDRTPGPPQGRQRGSARDVIRRIQTERRNFSLPESCATSAGARRSKTLFARVRDAGSSLWTRCRP